MNDVERPAVLEPDAVFASGEVRGVPRPGVAPYVPRGDNVRAFKFGIFDAVPAIVGSVIGAAAGALSGALLGLLAGPAGSLFGVFAGAFFGLVLGAIIARTLWAMVAMPVKAVVWGALALLAGQWVCSRFFHFSLWERFLRLISR
jgi:hypothetical protein